MSEDARLLKQEVTELTDLLRDEEALHELRTAIAGKGLRVEDLLLAGFLEDEEEREWGALVNRDARVFLYERSTADDARGFTEFQEVTDIAEAIELYPAIRVALEMATRRM